MDNEPENRDVKEFVFHQLCKVRVGPTPTSPPISRVSLLAACNKFGLVFAAYEEGFKVIRTADICQINKQHKDKNKPIEDFNFWSTVNTPGSPSHLSLSHDDLTLLVCCHRNSMLIAELYDVCSFSTQGRTTKPMFEVQLSNSTTDNLVDLQWNPGFPNVFATCLSNGTVALWDVKRGSGVNTIASAPLQVTSLFWSPKGKQIVLGQRNGFLVQVDHQLQPKREIAKPQGFPEGHHIINILWITTFCFSVVYQINDKSEQPNLMIITAPKQGQTTCLNCEDICYGQDEDRESKYYMFFLAQWGILIAASANSTDTGVLGRNPTNNDLFDMWILDDAARACCPSTENYTDTYPTGMAVDFTSQSQIRLSDENIHPPSPILMLLSTDGVLLPFYMINSLPGAPTVVKAPEKIQSSEQTDAVADATNAVQNAAFNLQSRLPQGGQKSIISSSKFTNPPVSVPPPLQPTLQSTLPRKSTLISASKFQSPTQGQGEALHPKVTVPSFQPVQQTLHTQQPQQPVLPKLQIQSPVSTKPKAQNREHQTTVLAPKVINQPVQPNEESISHSHSQEETEQDQSTAESDMTRTILDEVSHFEQELQDLKKRTAKCTGFVGSKNELLMMQKEVHDIMQLSIELKDNSEVNSSEICELKTKCLDLFTLMEECQILHHRNMDPSYINILRSKPLDPASINQRAELQAVIHYIESSIQELNIKLDSEWESHEEMMSIRRRRLQPPSSDDVYRTLKNNDDIVFNQRKLTDKLTSDLQSLKLQPSRYSDLVSSTKPDQL